MKFAGKDSFRQVWLYHQSHWTRKFATRFSLGGGVAHDVPRDEPLLTSCFTLSACWQCPCSVTEPLGIGTEVGDRFWSDSLSTRPPAQPAWDGAWEGGCWWEAEDQLRARKDRQQGLAADWQGQPQLDASSSLFAALFYPIHLCKSKNKKGISQITLKILFKIKPGLQILKKHIFFHFIINCNSNLVFGCFCTFHCGVLLGWALCGIIKMLNRCGQAKFERGVCWGGRSQGQS